MPERIVSFYVNGSIFPIEQGSQRVIYEMVRYLHHCTGLKVRLIVQAEKREEHLGEYKRLCHELVWLPPVPHRCFWALVNSILARMGIDILRGRGRAHWLRKRLLSAVEGSDWIVLNYAIWGFALPRRLRKQKTIVITHDLMFYRRASFGGRTTVLKRVLIALNRWIEVRFLKTFRYIGVFADYEQKLLEESGVCTSQIVRLGMPIAIRQGITDDERKKLPKYDFVVVGGNSYQNEAGLRTFFNRVVPLVAPRHISFAIVGGLCQSDIWSKLSIPASVSVARLGYVQNLQEVYSASRIGVGTVPYGSGVKVKVVETMMSGLPMIVTNSGEEGIPTIPCGCVNIDRLSESDVRARLLTWLDDAEQAHRDGMAEAAYVRAQFSPEVALKDLSDKCKSTNDDEFHS